jgi:hypothetical protein
MGHKESEGSLMDPISGLFIVVLVISFLVFLVVISGLGKTPIYYDHDFEVFLRRIVSEEVWNCLDSFFEDDDPDLTPPPATEPQSNVVQFPVPIEEEEKVVSSQPMVVRPSDVP